MTIKKYQGKTKEEAIDAAKAELGPRVVIMNVKEVHPNGFLGVFKKSTFEVTAAIEDEFAPADRESFSGRDEAVNALRDAVEEASSVRKREEPKVKETKVKEPDKKEESSFVYEEIKPRASFDAVADDTLTAGKKTAGIYERKGKPAPEAKPSQEKKNVSIDDLKSVFKEVNSVIETAPRVSVERPFVKNPESPIIKKDEVVKERKVESALDRLSEKSKEKEKEPVLRERVQSVPQNNNAPAAAEQKKSASENRLSGQKNAAFIKMLYNMLMEHEVDERYVNRIIDEMGDLIFKENSLDYLLFNVYQKIVLLLGTPHPVEIGENRPHVCFFIGPTGVGKTTTIAKIASDFKVRRRLPVSLITSDNYRIAAVKQLKVYADILKVPLSIAMTPDDMVTEIRKNSDADLILVDTTGFSHKNEEQRDNLKAILDAIPEDVSKQIYLVLSATTKYNDLKRIIDAYSEITDYDIIFTKLDETGCFGNILNSKLYSGKSLSYVTTGQSVPDDIEEIDMQRLTMLLLKGDADGSGGEPSKRN